MRAPVLVVGGDGLLGRALCAQLRREGIAHVMTSRHSQARRPGYLYLDLSEPSSWKLPEERWGTVVLAAAMTDMRQCEENLALAQQVNVEAPAGLARSLGAAGAYVVFLSTNAVFSGDRPLRAEDDPIDPVTAYGRQKAEAERAILSAAGSATIIRMTKVVHRGLAILKDWRESLQQKQQIRPFSDLVVSPISLGFATRGIFLAAACDLQGIFHLSGDRDVTYADLAYEFARLHGFDLSLIQPTTSAAAGVQLASLPKNSALAMKHSTPRLGIHPQSLAEALKYT